MSIINKQVPAFKAQAFHNGKFVEVSDQSIKGQWSAFIFMYTWRTIFYFLLQ